MIGLKTSQVLGIRAETLSQYHLLIATCIIKGVFGSWLVVRENEYVDIPH